MALTLHLWCWRAHTVPSAFWQNLHVGARLTYNKPGGGDVQQQQRRASSILSSSAKRSTAACHTVHIWRGAFATCGTQVATSASLPQSEEPQAACAAGSQRQPQNRPSHGSDLLSAPWPSSADTGEQGLALARSTSHNTPCWMCQEPFFTAGRPPPARPQRHPLVLGLLTQHQPTGPSQRRIIPQRAWFSVHADFLVFSHLLFTFIRKQVRWRAPYDRPDFFHKPPKFFEDENMADKRCFISHQLQQEVYGSLELFFLHAQASPEHSESYAWICRYAQGKQSRCCRDLCWSILDHRS